MPDQREPTQTVRQCADTYGVTIRTVRTWIAKGAVKVARTPSRGVRIVVEPIKWGVKNSEHQ